MRSGFFLYFDPFPASVGCALIVPILIVIYDLSVVAPSTFFIIKACLGAGRLCCVIYGDCQFIA